MKPTLMRFCAIALVPAIFLISLTASAQKGSKTPAVPAATNTFWILHNPLTWLEPEVPVSATIAYKHTARFAYELDAGVFVGKQDYNEPTLTIRPYSGFRLKPTVKFYIDGKQVGPTGFYLGLQGLIKYTSERKEEWMISNTANGFDQLVNYRERKSVLGGNFLLGGEFLLDKNQRFLLDIYAGAGVRNKKFTAVGLPPGFSVDYTDNERGFTIYRNGAYYYVALGLKFGIRL